MKYGALSLVFGKQDQLSQELPSSQTNSMQEQTQIVNEVEQIEHARSVREDLELLQLSDPLAYEKLIEGDIEGETP